MAWSRRIVLGSAVMVASAALGGAGGTAWAQGQAGSGKMIDQWRAECQAENPPGHGGDRSTLVTRCIQRKKAEAAAQKK